MENKWWSLKFLKPLERTLELSEKAIKLNGLALEWVPEHQKTKEMCEIAVANNPHALEWVPVKLLSSEMCLTAVTKIGNSIRWVPEGLKTEEVCLIALNSSVFCIDFIPVELRTLKIWEEIIKQRFVIVQEIPPNEWNSEMFRIAKKYENDSCSNLSKLPTFYFIDKSNANQFMSLQIIREGTFFLKEVSVEKISSDFIF